MADLSLVARSQQGDREAFSQLYLEYKDALYRYAWYKIGDPDYAMDAVSDTMLTALEQIGKLKNEKAFSTYLFRIHAAILIPALKAGFCLYLILTGRTLLSFDCTLLSSSSGTLTRASSRLVGNTFYIVSSYSINSSKNYVPLTCSGEGDSEKLNAKDIYYAKNGVGTDYIVVTALDVNTCETIGTTKAVLGCGGEVYGNKDYLYVYGSDYSGKEPNTTIAKISLKNGVKFCDYVKINGTVDSRYSFAEKDNHLCVFATETVKDKTCNYLYVLDSNLKQIYKSEPFAKGESIKAVKYVDDYAYVITYEQTDPLFIINLSNVKKPKFMGNVEIDGFSSMLVNVGDNQLLGVGYNTYFDNDVEVIDGLKFVLFDVSNSLEPKVLDEKVYKDLSSEAQYNPKAFVENKEKGYYAVPIVNVKGTQKGAIVVSVKDGKIVEKENYKAKLKTTSYGGMNTRVTYIDDYYYVVDNNLDVSSFELK